MEELMEVAKKVIEAIRRWAREALAWIVGEAVRWECWHGHEPYWRIEGRRKGRDENQAVPILRVKEMRHIRDRIRR